MGSLLLRRAQETRPCKCAAFYPALSRGFRAAAEPSAPPPHHLRCRLIWLSSPPVLPLLRDENETVSKLAVQYKGSYETNLGEEMLYWRACAVPSLELVCQRSASQTARGCSWDPTHY